MKQPKLVEEIVDKTVRAIRKPVTVKIRKGFDEQHVNAVEGSAKRGGGARPLSPFTAGRGNSIMRERQTGTSLPG